MQTNQVRQSVFPLLAAFIWGTAFVAQSVGAEYLGPFTFNTARSAVAFLFLLVLSLALGYSRRHAYAAEEPRPGGRRWRLSPGPPRCGVAPAPPGPCAGPGGAGRRWWSAPVSGVLVRPLWGCGRPWPSPPVSGPHPPFWAGSPFRHPVGRPLTDGPPPPLLRGNRRRDGRAKGRPAPGRIVPPPFPRWWGYLLFRAAVLPYGESCRKVSKLATCCHIV